MMKFHLKMWHIWTVVVVGAMLIGFSGSLAPDASSYAQSDAKTPTTLCEEAQATLVEPANRQFTEAESVLVSGVDYHAIFCTEQGPIYVDLFEEITPVTVNNFVFLAQQGYYNNTVFHRVIADFMVQGGDPTATGSGGPGYQFQDEFVPFVSFERSGLLAMANAGPATNGSQFFITRVPTPHLNPYSDPNVGALRGHTIFGDVLEGQDIVEVITNRDPSNPNDAGVEPDTLYTVLIITDPSTVETTYVEPTSVSGDEVFQYLTNDVYSYFSEQLSASSGLSPIEEKTRLLPDVDSVVAASSPDLSDQLTSLLTDNGFVYEVGTVWQVNSCGTSPGIVAFGLTITDWSTQANATRVVTDGADTLTALQTAEGFNLVDSADRFATLSWNGSLYPGTLFYSRVTTEFCDVSADHYRYIWSRSHYTLMIDLVVDFQDALDLTPDEFLTAMIADAIIPLAILTDDITFGITYPGVMPSDSQ